MILLRCSFFVRCVNENFDTTEELATLVPLKGTTKGSELLELVIGNSKQPKVKFEQHIRCHERWGAIYMRNRQGLVKLLQNIVSKAGNNSTVYS